MIPHPFRSLIRLLSVPLATWAWVPSAGAASAPIDLVDPMIGTGGWAHVFPGATRPFGFIQVSPDTGVGSGSGGYKVHKNIVGFSQQHISGMGGPIMGHLSVFPMTGELQAPASISSTGKEEERASPGYYAVRLKPWDVKVELTATRHVALHRHTFPAGTPGRVLVDAGHVIDGSRIGWGSAMPMGGHVHVNAAAQEVTGEMVYRGGRSAQPAWKIFFVVRFNRPFAGHGTWNDEGMITPGAHHSQGREVGAFLDFSADAPQVEAQVALSYHSLDQARAYFAAETPTWDFDGVHAAARGEWASVLAKIEVEGGTEDQRRQFYTALYRMHVTPNNWTGEAPVRYGKGTYYENILCLWDTIRTVNPLYTLIQPEVQRDIVNTILRYYQVDGWTGDAHSVHTYEHVQNGSSADVLIADAYVKKLPGIDYKLAYEAIRKNAFVDQNPRAEVRPMVGRFRLQDYLKHGYLPTDTTQTYEAVQAVSRTLEYIHNDYSVWTLAKEFGTPEDRAELKPRVTWYRNLWDAQSGGFMRGRKQDGSWHEPFDPTKTETGRQYYEGHAWTWSWYVPHDAAGLIALNGGPEAFVSKLTTVSEKYYEVDNEPCMLISYLFLHAGRPDLTQRFVREQLRHFSSKPEGLPGNDDSGTTSGWLLWAMLGLYPNSGQDFYYIGSPLFTKATIHLAGGKKLVISAPEASAEAKFIRSARLNGKEWSRAWIRHGEFINGAELRFEMSAEAAPVGQQWGAQELPPSYSR